MTEKVFYLIGMLLLLIIPIVLLVVNLIEIF
jgi:hypothetical protein